MLCGNTAALNNYEIEQHRLESQPAFSDSAEIARELMKGGTYSNSGQTWSMDDVVDQMLECGNLRDILKSLALNIENPLKQTKTVERLNRLIQEYAICVAEELEV
ncbi:hypothetical protein [Spartinivicinus ruber]|uniref:hypothetical protein n=1 Tax=Spartinivicinus ruber TaxID=2683272 RepID=UPI0013D735CD|nr:hypothetical protein [Spartinivicinus ruber]